MHSLQRTYSQLLNLRVQPSWITNYGGLPCNNSIFILTSYGLIFLTTRIFFVSVGCIFTSNSNDFIFFIAPLISNLLNSSHNFVGTQSKWLRIGIAHGLKHQRLCLLLILVVYIVLLEKSSQLVCLKFKSFWESRYLRL